MLMRMLKKSYIWCMMFFEDFDDDDEVKEDAGRV